MTKIGILDYGAANIPNVVRAFDYIRVESLIIKSPKQISEVTHLVLPGVSTFSFASESLKKSGLDGATIEAIYGGTPTLGICLGMQLLLPFGNEFGNAKGLSLIDGTVEELPAYRNEFPDRKPRIGWFPVNFSTFSKGKFFQDFDGKFFYFAHSYFVQPKSLATSLSCTFQNSVIPVAIEVKNVLGVQFHPEKSGRAGSRLLSKFAALE